jgi:hypothetical protein
MRLPLLMQGLHLVLAEHGRSIKHHDDTVGQMRARSPSRRVAGTLTTPGDRSFTLTAKTPALAAMQ